MTQTEAKPAKTTHPALLRFDEQRKHLKRVIKAFEGMTQAEAVSVFNLIVPTLPVELTGDVD